MQQQRSVYVYQHWPPCQICGAAVSKLQSGLATAAAQNTTKVQEIPKDEAKRINQDEIKTDVFAKEEIETDGFDLTERSGRAVKVSTQVTCIYYIVLTFCIYLD